MADIHGVEAYDGDQSGGGSDTGHPHVVGLFLKRATVNEQDASVGADRVDMDVAGMDDVGDAVHDEPVTGFRGEQGARAVSGGHVAAPDHSFHGRGGIAVVDPGEHLDEVVKRVAMEYVDFDAVELEVTGVTE